MSTITCPICRHDTSVPAGGVAELRSAFHINNLLEIECDLKHAVSKEAVNMLGENKMKKKEVRDSLEIYNIILGEYQYYKYAHHKAIFLSPRAKTYD